MQYRNIGGIALFRAKFEGANLVIVGGEYDERQAQRLSDVLGVRLPKRNWVTNSQVKAGATLKSRIRKADLVLCFIKSMGHGSYRKAKALARIHGTPLIVSMNLNPEAVAQMALTFEEQIVSV